MYDIHEYANLFPMMSTSDFEELQTDIKANGLAQSIVLFEGKILDGRNRYLACQNVGVEPRFETYEGPDAMSYVISLNLRRRQLTSAQKAACAANEWNGEKGAAKGGRPSKKPGTAGFSLTALEARWNTRYQSIEIAYGLKTNADDESINTFNGMFSGEVEMTAARDVWETKNAAAAAAKTAKAEAKVAAAAEAAAAEAAKLAATARAASNEAKAKAEAEVKAENESKAAHAAAVASSFEGGSSKYKETVAEAGAKAGIQAADLLWTKEERKQAQRDTALSFDRLCEAIRTGLTPDNGNTDAERFQALLFNAVEDLLNLKKNLAGGMSLTDEESAEYARHLSVISTLSKELAETVMPVNAVIPDTVPDSFFDEH